MTTLRNYTDCNSVVKETYKKQRMYQCTDFVKYCIDKYCKFDQEATFLGPL